MLLPGTQRGSKCKLLARTGITRCCCQPVTLDPRHFLSLLNGRSLDVTAQANRTLSCWWDTPRQHGRSGVGVGTRPIGESEVRAVHAVKTYEREFGGTTPRILYAGTSYSSVCPHTSLYPGVGVEGNIPDCPLNRRLGGP